MESLNPIFVQTRVDNFVDLYRTIDECVDLPEPANPLPFADVDYDPPEPVVTDWAKYLPKEAANDVAVHTKLLPYTLGPSVKTSVVDSEEYCFADFIEEIRQPKRLKITHAEFAELNKGGRAKWKNPNRHVVPGHMPDGKRNRLGVRAITLLCIDIDKPEFAEKAKEALPKLRLNHFAYPTISSEVPDVKTGEAGLRLRLFIETDGSVPVPQYKEAVLSVLAAIDLEESQVDAASFKAENAMFLPMCFSDDEDWEPLSVLTAGEVFTADRIQAAVPEPIPEANRPATTSDEIALANLPSGESIEKIESALSAISPDAEFHAWFTMLSGIHHATGGSEEGWRILDTWSKGTQKKPAHNYDERENRKYWDGLSRKEPVINPVTIGSVFAAAKEHGWNPKEWKSEADESDLDGLTPEEARSRWEALPLEQRGARVFTDRQSRKRVPELVKSLLTGNGTIGVVGDSQTGKSTLLTSLSWAVVTDREFLGRKIGKPIPDRPSAVFYIAAEDVMGVEDRWRANMKLNGLDPNEWDDRFLVREAPANLHDADQLKRLYEAIYLYEIAFGVKVRLVIFDTLRANASDGTAENSNDDMNRAVLNVHQIIQKPLGCACVLTHHTNKKDKTVFSGGNAFRGALDQVLLLKRDQRSDAVQMIGNKYRGGDASKMDDWFEIEVVPLGIHDEDGDEISSVVAVDSGKTPSEMAPPEERNTQNIATENELSILIALRKTPSKSLAELQERAKLADRSCRNALDRLVDNGFVSTEKNGKSKLCRITETGKQHIKQFEGEVITVMVDRDLG